MNHFKKPIILAAILGTILGYGIFNKAIGLPWHLSLTGIPIGFFIIFLVSLFLLSLYNGIKSDIAFNNKYGNALKEMDIQSNAALPEEKWINKCRIIHDENGEIFGVRNSNRGHIPFSRTYWKYVNGIVKQIAIDDMPSVLKSKINRQIYR